MVVFLEPIRQQFSFHMLLSLKIMMTPSDDNLLNFAQTMINIVLRTTLVSVFNDVLIFFQRFRMLISSDGLSMVLVYMSFLLS